MEYDLVVLGSGPGGYTAAFRAADLGLNVALVERYSSLGGVCLNVGCIPSKALLHATKVISDAKAMDDNGVSFGAPTINLRLLRQWKERTVKKLADGLDGLARQRKVTILRGIARFTSPTSVCVENNSELSNVAFSKAIIATGSQPVELSCAPQDERIMDSTQALALEKIPEHLLIVGGGIIGLEMATIYNGLGSAVTIVEMSENLMIGVDRDIVKPLESRLREDKVMVYTETKVTAIDADSDDVRVTFEGRDIAQCGHFDKVLVAVGRKANTVDIGLNLAGVHTQASGTILVDEQMKTNVSHIFAIGDVVGQSMLAHKAVHEGKVAAEVCAGEKTVFDAKVIPAVAYTDPEVAWVGMTETKAREEGVKISKSTFPWMASGRSLAMGRSEGITKLLLEPDSGRLVGAGIVGQNAGDLISEVTFAIEMGADAADLGLTVHPHPTLSETIPMAAEVFSGTITDLYLPKRQ